MATFTHSLLLFVCRLLYCYIFISMSVSLYPLNFRFIQFAISLFAYRQSCVAIMLTPLVHSHWLSLLMLAGSNVFPVTLTVQLLMT